MNGEIGVYVAMVLFIVGVPLGLWATIHYWHIALRLSLLKSSSNHGTGLP
jgi:hypothetical protein